MDPKEPDKIPLSRKKMGSNDERTHTHPAQDPRAEPDNWAFSLDDLFLHDPNFESCW
jgi:hypothetical protein